MVNPCCVDAHIPNITTGWCDCCCHLVLPCRYHHLIATKKLVSSVSVAIMFLCVLVAKQDNRMVYHIPSSLMEYYI